MYASPALYLVKHPIDLGLYGTVGIMTAGVLCIWANYDADRQRHSFRQVYLDIVCVRIRIRVSVSMYVSLGVLVYLRVCLCPISVFLCLSRRVIRLVPLLVFFYG